MAIIPTPDEVNQFHLYSDKDSSVTALHHTLGQGPTQAAAGNHTHNGRDSKKIKFEDIDGGWMNIDGGRASTLFGGLPSIDGGSI
jgi:hypothetical protein